MAQLSTNDPPLACAGFANKYSKRKPFSSLYIWHCLPGPALLANVKYSVIQDPVYFLFPEENGKENNIGTEEWQFKKKNKKRNELVDMTSCAIIDRTVDQSRLKIFFKDAPFPLLVILYQKYALFPQTLLFQWKK